MARNRRADRGRFRRALNEEIYERMGGQQVTDSSDDLASIQMEEGTIVLRMPQDAPDPDPGEEEPPPPSGGTTSIAVQQFTTLNTLANGTVARHHAIILPPPGAIQSRHVTTHVSLYKPSIGESLPCISYAVKSNRAGTPVIAHRMEQATDGSFLHADPEDRTPYVIVVEFEDAVNWDTPPDYLVVLNAVNPAGNGGLTPTPLTRVDNGMLWEFTPDGLGVQLQYPISFIVPGEGKTRKLPAGWVAPMTAIYHGAGLGDTNLTKITEIYVAWHKPAQEFRAIVATELVIGGAAPYNVANNNTALGNWLLAEDIFALGGVRITIPDGVTVVAGTDSFVAKGATLTNGTTTRVDEERVYLGNAVRTLDGAPHLFGPVVCLPCGRTSGERVTASQVLKASKFFGTMQTMHDRADWGTRFGPEFADADNTQRDLVDIYTVRRTGAGRNEFLATASDASYDSGLTLWEQHWFGRGDPFYYFYGLTAACALDRVYYRPGALTTLSSAPEWRWNSLSFAYGFLLTGGVEWFRTRTEEMIGYAFMQWVEIFNGSGWNVTPTEDRRGARAVEAIISVLTIDLAFPALFNTNGVLASRRAGRGTSWAQYLEQVIVQQETIGLMYPGEPGRRPQQTTPSWRDEKNNVVMMTQKPFMSGLSLTRFAQLHWRCAPMFPDAERASHIARIKEVILRDTHFLLTSNVAARGGKVWEGAEPENGVPDVRGTASGFRYLAEVQFKLGVFAAGKPTYNYDANAINPFDGSLGAFVVASSTAGGVQGTHGSMEETSAAQTNAAVGTVDYSLFASLPGQAALIGMWHYPFAYCATYETNAARKTMFRHRLRTAWRNSTFLPTGTTTYNPCSATPFICSTQYGKAISDVGLGLGQIAPLVEHIQVNGA
jgi:hypothetical protein